MSAFKLDIGQFEALQTNANTAMGLCNAPVSNTQEDVEQMQTAAGTYSKIISNAIRKAARLLKTKNEYETAQTEWTTAKSSYKSGKQDYLGVYEAVRQARKIQAENALKAKKNGNMIPLQEYLDEDNKIRDITMPAFAKDRKLNALIDQIAVSKHTGLVTGE